MNRLIKFFHQLKHPHCPDCMDEVIEKKMCNSCEMLRMEIERLRQQNEMLLNKIVSPPSPTVVESKPEGEVLRPRIKPWKVIQQELEKKDRELAQELKKKWEEGNKGTEQLEKELGVN